MVIILAQQRGLPLTLCKTLQEGLACRPGHNAGALPEASEGLPLILCKTLQEGLACPWRGLAAATLFDACGKAPALLQTRQVLWNHLATLMV